MFPAYSSSSQSVKIADDLSWLQCTSYPNIAANEKEKAGSDSTDTDQELIQAIEKRKADAVQDSTKKRSTSDRSSASASSSEDSDDDDDGHTSRHRRHRKQSKKSKKKKRNRDSHDEHKRDRSSSRRHKKKKSKKRRSRSPRSASASLRTIDSLQLALRRKWTFLDSHTPTDLPFVVDIRGDQSNRAFAQLPHTSAAVYKAVRVRGAGDRKRKKPKRYFKVAMAPPMITVEVNEKLSALKPSNYISLGDALLADSEEAAGDGRPSWPSLVREHVILAAECRDKPYDVLAWLKLCDFEKIYVPCSLGGAQVTGAALQKMIMEKQLSVMTDAIMKNPLDLNLRLRKFDLLCSLERQDELAREWDDVLRMSDYSISKQQAKNEIWLKYAQYARSKFRVVAKFSVDEATAGYRRAIDAYRRTRNDDLFLVSLIEDFARFLVQCGHSERAIAIFQALLDFNLSQPGYLSTEKSEDVAKTIFESFWDSSSPKIGDDNHQGWGQEPSHSNDVPPPQEDDPREDELINADRPLNAVWATLETLRQRTHWMPAKVDAEDVERIILFDDVQMCVFRSRDPKCLRKMLVSFMTLLATGDDTYMAWNSTTDRMVDLLKMPFARDEAEGRMLVLWNCYKAGTVFLPQFDWAEVFLDQLLRLCPSDKDKAVSLAKKVMQVKAHQMNLTLWAKLLLILAAGRARDEAMSRGVKLMSMACAGLSNFAGDHVYFLAVYLRIHLDVDDFLKIDLDEPRAQRMPDIRSLFSYWGALILGKKAMLSEVDDEHITRLADYLGNRRDEYSIEVAMILNLSTDGPRSAYAYLSRKASMLSVDAYHRLNVLLHLLVYRYFSLSSSLADLRRTVQLACEKAPTTQEHMILLAVISYRGLHSWKHCPIPQSEPEHAWFATILFHLLRQAEYSQWKEHEEIAYSGTRLGGLRRAIAQIGEVRHPLFWRLTAWAEMQAGEPERAKELLLRGLQCCPWSKAIFVDCALYFDDMLQQVVDTLTEKGLRLRTPLEELTLLLEARDSTKEIADTAIQ